MLDIVVAYVVDVVGIEDINVVLVGGVDGLIFFSSPNAVEELVHVHGPEILAVLAEGVLELVESERVDGRLSS